VDFWEERFFLLRVFPAYPFIYTSHIMAMADYMRCKSKKARRTRLFGILFFMYPVKPMGRKYAEMKNRNANRLNLALAA
ncbi:MAG: hypothetical protein FWB96_12525, partial [Defluviitaleaceae bacterium]|nr:hypothetical protein [Defluviitaleaceae bacterium]MCL2264073.1 hypothetical protein [Defluviitaleaceae bacterium]